MIQHGEDNIATEQNKKWYSIYKNNICCHKYIFVKLDDFPGNLVKVPRELIKLHKYIFVIADIIFVKWNTIFYFDQSQYYLHHG